MTDLHDKARALLALRDKADEAPWIANGIAIEGAMEVPEFELPTFNKYENTKFAAAAHDMADTIAELLTENERLAAALSVAKEIILKLDADRADLYARAEAAEARLRELASAEPVACVCTYEGSDGIPFSVFVDPSTARRSPPDIGEPVPLIPRPSMEGKANG